MPLEVCYVRFEVTGIDGTYYVSVDGEKSRSFKSYTGALLYVSGLVTQGLKDTVIDDGERVWGADANSNG